MRRSALAARAHLAVWLQTVPGNLRLRSRVLADDAASLVHRLVLVELIQTELRDQACMAVRGTPSRLGADKRKVSKNNVADDKQDQRRHTWRYSVGFARPRGSKPRSPGSEPSSHDGRVVFGSQSPSPADQRSTWMQQDDRQGARTTACNGRRDDM